MHEDTVLSEASLIVRFGHNNSFNIGWLIDVKWRKRLNSSMSKHFVTLLTRGLIDTAAHSCETTWDSFPIFKQTLQVTVRLSNWTFKIQGIFVTWWKSTVWLHVGQFIFWQEANLKYSLRHVAQRECSHGVCTAGRLTMFWHITQLNKNSSSLWHRMFTLAGTWDDGCSCKWLKMLSPSKSKQRWWLKIFSVQASA